MAFKSSFDYHMGIFYPKRTASGCIKQYKIFTTYMRHIG